MANDAKQLGKQLERQVRQAIKRGLLKSALLVQGSAKEKAPVGKTGLLAASINIDESKLDNFEISVYTNVKYAPAIEYEVAPYIIRPKNKQALAFNWGNAPVPANGKDGRHVYKEVKHPGSAAAPFMRPALDENMGRIKKIIANEINKVTK